MTKSKPHFCVSHPKEEKSPTLPSKYEEEINPLHLLARAPKQSRLAGGALRTSIQCKLYALKLNSRPRKPKKLHTTPASFTLQTLTLGRASNTPNIKTEL
jgi:hypothetical protein